MKWPVVLWRCADCPHLTAAPWDVSQVFLGETFGPAITYVWAVGLLAAGKVVIVEGYSEHKCMLGAQGYIAA
jgi:hypothetical protein